MLCSCIIFAVCVPVDEGDRPYSLTIEILCKMAKTFHTSCPGRHSRGSGNPASFSSFIASSANGHDQLFRICCENDHSEPSPWGLFLSSRVGACRGEACLARRGGANREGVTDPDDNPVSPDQTNPTAVLSSSSFISSATGGHGRMFGYCFFGYWSLPRQMTTQSRRDGTIPMPFPFSLPSVGEM